MNGHQIAAQSNLVRIAPENNQLYLSRLQETVTSVKTASNVKQMVQ